MAKRVTLHLRNGKSASSTVKQSSDVQKIVDVLLDIWCGTRPGASFTFPDNPAMYINAAAVDLLEVEEVA